MSVTDERDKQSIMQLEGGSQVPGLSTLPLAKANLVTHRRANNVWFHLYEVLSQIHKLKKIVVKGCCQVWKELFNGQNYTFAR